MAIALIVLGSVLGAAPAGAGAFEIKTEAPTNVGATSATLNGTLESKGYNEALYVFAYGTDSEVEANQWQNTQVETLEGESLPVPVSTIAVGLQPETKYTVKIGAYIPDIKKYFEGEALTFTTSGYHSAQFEAGSYPVTVSGEVQAEPFASFGEQELTCNTVELSGESTAAATSQVLDAEYDACQLDEIEVEVEMRSCQFAVGAENSWPSYGGGLDIECGEEGDFIRVGNASCHWDVPAQGSAENALAFENSGEGDSTAVDVSGDADGLNYTVDGLFCGFLGAKKGSYEDGVINLDPLTLTAESEASQVGFLISGAGAEVGVRVVAGEEEEEDSQFDADLYPVGVSGAGDGGSVASFGGQALVCESRAYSGEIAVATSALSLGATYSECAIGGIEVDVEMRSCGMVFEVGSGSPATGDLGIECAEEGDFVRVGNASCHWDIPVQSSEGGALEYENTGEGVSAAVDVSGDADGLNYTVDGLFCGFMGAKKGSYENGSIDANVRLSGVYAG